MRSAIGPKEEALFLSLVVNVIFVENIEFLIFPRTLLLRNITSIIKVHCNIVLILLVLLFRQTFIFCKIFNVFDMLRKQTFLSMHRMQITKTFTIYRFLLTLCKNSWSYIWDFWSEYNII